MADQKNPQRLTPEYEQDLRTRINPAWVSVPGTESFERAILLAEIDALRDELAQAQSMVAALRYALDYYAINGKK
jgi:hypothetical protein